MIYAISVSFLLGIISEYFFHFDSTLVLFFIFLSTICFAFFKIYSEEDVHVQEKFRVRGSVIFLLVIFCFVGIWRMSHTSISISENIASLVGQEVSFDAIITEEPDRRDEATRYTVSVVETKDGTYDCLARLDGASTRNFPAEKYPCNQKYQLGSVLLIANRFPEFKYGDKVHVSGKLDVPKNFISDTDIEFDYVSYLAKDDIHFLIYRPNISLIKNGEESKILSLLFLIKQSSIENISHVVSEPYSSFIAGVLFGNKQSLGQDLLDTLKKVGLIHVVVLSGYNLTIIALLIIYLTSFSGRKNLGLLISLIVLVLFSLMVGLTSTVLRALLMTFLGLLAQYLGRPHEALRALFVAGFVMVLWNPSIVTADPSFQLSWMATFGLILWTPILEKFLAEKFVWFSKHKEVREVVASTISVQLFLLPLLMRMSGIFSPFSFFVNLIVLPFVPSIMFFGFVTSVLGFISHFISWPFGVVAYLLTHIVLSVANFSASLPFLVLSVGSLPLILILVWYVCYGLLYLKIKNKFL